MQDAASFTDSGGFVTSITNKASSTAWTEGTVPPAWSSTAFNGLPGMAPTGTRRIISTEAAVVAALSGGAAYTVFYAGAVNTADAAMAFFGAGNSGQATASTRFFGNNTTGAGVWIVSARNNANTIVNVESTGAANTDSNVFECYTDGSVTSLQINGAAADPNGAAQATGALTPDRASLFSRPASTPGIMLNGEMGELLLYSRLLNATERDQVRAYLGARWGITVT
jgi:hypothetical protein